MAITGRTAIREAIGSGLSTAMTAAKTVSAFQNTQWSAKNTPLVRVMSAGSERPQLTAQGLRSILRFSVDIWVLFGLEDGSWSASDAEEVLDTLELQLVSWVTDNQLGELWTALQYDGASFIEPVKLERGEVYLVERLFLRAEVFE